MMHQVPVNEDLMATGPYDQMLLFGDSITQQSCSQANGFALTPALQDGRATSVPISASALTVVWLLAFIRRLDVINRGFSVGFRAIFVDFVYQYA